MPNAIASVRGLTDRAMFRLAPLRTDAADILHPLLFIFDTAKEVAQRYFPLLDVVPSWRTRRSSGVASREGFDAGIPDAGGAFRISRGGDPRPCRARVVLVPQSREPLADGTLHAVESPARSVLPRDDRHVPVPAARRDHDGNARPAGSRGARPVSGVRAVDRRSRCGGSRGPSPDRDDVEAVGEDDPVDGG